jgi:pimeloyl-ACP methyl ester carboxylesterase
VTAPATERVTHISHGRVRLALHQLRAGDGRPLLLLHGLGERAPRELPAAVEAWTGPVHALDFTGHGESDVPAGGGYTCETLLSDADTAVAHLGPLTVLGRGLGGYVALLLAGSRPTAVRGTIISDGPGLAGGGPKPGSAAIITVDPATPAPPDPFALAELSRDVRPPDYASSFARQATHLSGLTTPIIVTARLRPEWLTAVLTEPGVEEMTLAGAVAHYAADSD